MPFLNWDDSFDVHVSEMNTEHQHIIELVNQIYDQNERGPKDWLRDKLIELFSYTKMHFSNEEMYMEKIQFADVSTHKVIHRQLMESLEEHLAEFEKGNGTVSDKFLSFLRMWLQSHIKCIDVKYGE